MSNKTPELLAPAGSIESFHGAIEGGADAVYLGLTDFNARLRAENFSIKTISYLLPYARKRGVKLYVTLNTLVKQAELEKLVHTLYQLEQIGVDALIVADTGLIHIARSFFPKLALHASTQMTIHNSAGARAAENMGLKRVILSRELTLEEIAAIRQNTSAELECFVHGALCYGISGLCLASSFLGGSSGNRGRCTQVCRRKFIAGSARGYFFSSKDLGALGLLPRLIAAGVTSLKIEGRMKGADYVYSVVKAFRVALDNPGQNLPAPETVIRDFGRKKTTAFLNGFPGRGIIDASCQSGVGEPIGKITALRQDTIMVAGTMEIMANDRIRIQPESGFDGESATVLKATGDNGTLTIVLKKPVVCSTGDTVYLTGRPGGTQFGHLRGVTDTVPIEFKPAFPFVRKVMDTYAPDPGSAAPEPRETLWFKINNTAWLDHLHATPCQRLVLAGEPDMLSAFIKDSARLKPWRSRLVLALPPFIPEHNLLTVWCALIDKSKKAGVTSWLCSNTGHSQLFESQGTLVAGQSLPALNRAAKKALLDRGHSLFTYSLEDDYLNIKAAVSSRGIATLFSVVPLFVSRIHPAVKPNVPIADPHGNRFFTEQENDLHYLFGQKVFCLTHRRKKLSELGIKNFLLDLSFFKPDSAMLGVLMDCYKNGTRLPDSTVFNFKAGLK